MLYYKIIYHFNEIKRSKLLCLFALIATLTFGSTLPVSAAMQNVNVKKWQGSYYATMNLTRNLSSGTISNGKYVNSGKKNTVSDPGSWNHKATKSVGLIQLGNTKCR